MRIALAWASLLRLRILFSEEAEDCSRHSSNQSHRQSVQSVIQLLLVPQTGDVLVRLCLSTTMSPIYSYLTQTISWVKRHKSRDISYMSVQPPRLTFLLRRCSITDLEPVRKLYAECPHPRDGRVSRPLRLLSISYEEQRLQNIRYVEVDPLSTCT